MSGEPINAQRLAEWAALAERAQAQPWTAPTSLQDDRFAAIYATPTVEHVADYVTRRDADFIIAAREAVPALLGEVVRLTTQLAEQAESASYETQDLKRALREAQSYRDAHLAAKERWQARAEKAEAQQLARMIEIFGTPRPECWCGSCEGEWLRGEVERTGDWSRGLQARFIVCPDCGDKRCPRARFHDNDCTTPSIAANFGSGETTE